MKPSSILKAAFCLCAVFSSLSVSAFSESGAGQVEYVNQHLSVISFQGQVAKDVYDILGSTGKDKSSDDGALFCFAQGASYGCNLKVDSRTGSRLPQTASNSYGDDSNRQVISGEFTYFAAKGSVVEIEGKAAELIYNSMVVPTPGRTGVEYKQSADGGILCSKFGPIGSGFVCEIHIKYGSGTIWKRAL